MGTKVTFKIVSSGNPFVFSTKKNDLVPDYKDGQIIFVEDQCKIYLDFHDERKCYTPDVPVSSGGLRYLGIFDDGFDQDDETTWKIGGDSVSPNENDMAVYGNKEFMYRKGEDGKFGWFEIGDEDAPVWN